MRVKLIKADTPEELEVSVNKFIEKLGVGYRVESIQIFGSAGIRLSDYYYAMLVISYSED